MCSTELKFAADCLLHWFNKNFKSKNLEINSSTKTKYEISHRNFSTNMANCYNSDDYATNSSIKFNFTKFGSDYTMKDLTFSNVGNNDMIINLIDYDENKLSMWIAKEGAFKLLFEKQPCKTGVKSFGRLMKKVKTSKETNILK